MEENNENSNQSNDAANSEWRKRELGALWVQQGKSQKYLTGYISVDDLGIEKKRLVVFKKTQKSNDKAPDFVIYESKDMSSGSDSDLMSSSEVSEGDSSEESQPKVSSAEVEDSVPQF
jgi:hypothetical protein